jgi:hypothetical protein
MLRSMFRPHNHSELTAAASPGAPKVLNVWEPLIVNARRLTLGRPITERGTTDQVASLEVPWTQAGGLRIQVYPLEDL